jgi:hypothetical protein
MCMTVSRLPLFALPPKQRCSTNWGLLDSNSPESFLSQARPFGSRLLVGRVIGRNFSSHLIAEKVADSLSVDKTSDAPSV